MVTGNNISDSKDRISIKLIKLISLSLLAILIIGSTSNVQATVVFYDDFEDGDLNDWELYGWNDASGTNEVIAHDISIVNGAMKTPDSSSSVTTYVAQRNSTTAVGTWSFDIILNRGTSSEDATRFSVEFMFTDLSGNYDQTGLNDSDFRWVGYSLFFVTYTIQGEVSGPGISLFLLNSSDTSLFKFMKGYNMTREEITGNHHVDITRDENGTISLYFDMIQLFSINDKSVNFSEKFQLVSVLGGVAFDNIRISNVVEEIDPPTVSSSSSSSSQESTLPSSSSTNEDESSENDDNPISLTVWVISFLALLIIRKRPN